MRDFFKKIFFIIRPCWFASKKSFPDLFPRRISSKNFFPTFSRAGFIQKKIFRHSSAQTRLKNFFLSPFLHGREVKNLFSIFVCADFIPKRNFRLSFAQTRLEKVVFVQHLKNIASKKSVLSNIFTLAASKIFFRHSKVKMFNSHLRFSLRLNFGGVKKDFSTFH